ncbi:MAG: hypothetical protein NTY35_16915 [Planctomycetota bacterium]|nr:hypothetical protein [Planctomycetota bacterium]
MLPKAALIVALAVSAHAQCLDWSRSFPPAGIVDEQPGYGNVYATVEHDDGSGPALFVGGAFAGAGLVSCPHVVRWNGTAFEALAGGLPYAVSGLYSLDLGAGRELYAALGVIGPDSLYRWDGAGWHSIPGTSRAILDLEVFDFGSGPELVIARDDNATHQYVQRRTANGWVQVGPGPNYTVHALAVYDDGTGPALYAIGAFNGIGANGLPLRGLARWNGAGWVGVGGGLDNGTGGPSTGYDLAVWDDGSGPKLVAGGEFVAVGGQPIPYVAAWNGTTWSSLGAGVVGPVSDVESVVLASGPKLVVAGNLTQAGGNPARSPVVFDGAQWTSLGTALSIAAPGTASATAFTAHDDGSGRSLFVGGRFANAGGTVAASIARWDESQWHALGVARGISGTIFAWARHDDGSGMALYAGGVLDGAGDQVVRQVARFDGTSWSAVGPVPAVANPVRALLSADVGAGSRLYAAGNYSAIAGTAADCIAAWDGQAWAPLPGGGLTASLAAPLAHALAVHDDGSGKALYVGGFFGFAGGVPANRIARWSPSGWTGVGTGFTSGEVKSLAVFDDGTGAKLYAGGTMPERVARWNGSTWQGLPQPPANGGGDVQALGSWPYGSQPLLFVGGRFSSVGGVSTYNLGAWDGAAWRTFGAGATGIPNGSVSAFHLVDDGRGAGPKLYAGGLFGTIDGVPGASVCAWNGTAWESAAQGGVNGSVKALGSLDDGEGAALYVGGAFTASSVGVATNLARYGRHGQGGCGPVTGASFCDGSGAGAACPCGNPGIAGSGCANSGAASGARLSARGAANVGLDDVTLDVRGTTPSGTVLFFQGTSPQAGGAGVAFGDGVRCVGGSQVRLAVRVAVLGAASFGAAVAGDPRVSSAGGLAGGGERLYQVWYRDAQPAYCTSSTFNLSNGIAIRWAD